MISRAGLHLRLHLTWLQVGSMALLIGLGVTAFHTRPAPLPPLRIGINECYGLSILAPSFTSLEETLTHLRERRLLGVLDPLPSPSPACQSYHAVHIDITAFDTRTDATTAAPAKEAVALRSILGDGQPIEKRYAALADCIGLSSPLPLPTLVIRPRSTLACGNGEVGCFGTYRKRSRVIHLTYATIASLQHELLHDLLHQRGTSDATHDDRAWRDCLGPLKDG